MKELEHIKKVEDEVSRKIESARSQADKKISGMKSGKDALIEEQLKPVKTKLERDAEKNRVDAESEAASMLKSSDVKVKEIEKRAKKNFDKAVKLVLGFLSYDRV